MNFHTAELNSNTAENMTSLTTVENIAWRFPDVGQNDVVLSKPLPVKQEPNFIELRLTDCSHLDVCQP